MRAFLLTSLIITLGFSAPMAMAGDAAAGETKSQVCQACHGADGNGVDPSYPRLAGQHEDYLRHALAAYRSGDRSNAVMATFAQNLSDEDIADLAAYYAAMEGLFSLDLD